MYSIGKIAMATMAVAVTSMIASDAEARSSRFGGSFSRMSSFSAPRTIQRASFSPSKPAQPTKSVRSRSETKPNVARRDKPLKLANLPVNTAKPPRQILPTKPPVKVKLPPLKPGFPKPQPPIGGKNPPGHNNPPSWPGGHEGGISIEIGGGDSGLITVAPQETMEVTVKSDCTEYYAKWQETGDKMWKLTYYECTGQL